jgi:hypothetical protein
MARLLCNNREVDTVNMLHFSPRDHILGQILLRHYNLFSKRPKVKFESCSDVKSAFRKKAVILMKYATAAYGWYVVNNAFFPDKSGNILAGENYSGTICSHINIPAEDLVLVYEQAEGTLAFMPAHYVAVDHANKTVVIAIRGTLDVLDVVTVLACNVIPYDIHLPVTAVTSDVNSTTRNHDNDGIPSNKYKPTMIIKSKTHEGFLKGAKNVMNNIETIAVQLSSEYPDYEIVVVGHR